MRTSKVFLSISCLLFLSLGGVALFKKKLPTQSLEEKREVIEELLLEESPPVVVAPPPVTPVKELSKEVTLSDSEEEVDRVPRLFALDSTKLPIVETLCYTSRVPWLKGRPAWISDYASHYSTSRHFIARSLNKKLDYLSQKVSPGDRFNVFKLGINFGFHLLLDLSRCRMWFYYVNQDTNERVLLKVYRVGVGRPDSKETSKSLTPVGTYQLGEKVAIYKPGTQGIFQNRKTEMVRVFGTRWIPFEKNQGSCGLGIHGAPWIPDPVTGILVEDRSKIGKYDSDGCIRLLSQDIEELFSIVITKNTTLEIVNQFSDAQLPGVERSL